MTPNTMTKTTTRSLLPIQKRIHAWQRDVAGQPLTEFGAGTTDPSFFKAQLSFVQSEWFDEFVPHHIASQAGIIAIAVAKGVREDLLDGETLIRREIADDIGDVAFTTLGLLNAVGQNVDRCRVGQLASEMTLISGVSDLLDRLKNLSVPEDARAEITKVYGSMILASLRVLSRQYAIPFKRTLLAVCDSNDTKLWTPNEVHEKYGSQPLREPYDSRSATTQEGHFLRKLDLGAGIERVFRVTNGAGKLIKSPSFTEPDLSFITSGGEVFWG